MVKATFTVTEKQTILTISNASCEEVYDITKTVVEKSLYKLLKELQSLKDNKKINYAKVSKS